MPAKCALLLLALAVLCATASARTRGKLVLVENGKSDFVIVIGAKASPSEQHAAQELQTFLAEMSDAKLPIVSDDGPMRPHEIILGDNRHLSQSGIKVNFEKLGDEGFNLRVTDRLVAIAGGRLRGTMYGVYTLLEDYLGCRWFSSDVSRIPKLDCVALGRLNDTQVPALEYREPFYIDAFDADWAARNKMNSASARLDAPRGGKITYKGFVHTFYPLLPPDQYFAQHPEYFSLVKGKRTTDGAQLCLTNPEVVRIVTESVRRWLAESPEANIVSVSQNDCYGWCECDNCKAIDDREGSHAGTMINFVNQIAANIEKDYPNVAIDTLAYQYTRKPPKTIRPRHNVIVRLCSIECCFSHPLATDDYEQNVSFRDDIVGWHKLTDRLYIWDYVTSFAHYLNPFPNLEVLGPNIQFFVNNGVKGVFEEGNYGSLGGELAELRAYLMAKFLWNPDYDQEKALSEFLEGYYGQAAGPIRAYLDMLHEKVKQDHIHMHIWTGPDAKFLTTENLEHAQWLFKSALRRAENDQVRLRVQVAQLPLQYVQIMRLKPGPKRLRLLDEFMAVARQKKITQIREGGPIEQWEEEIRKQG